MDKLLVFFCFFDILEGIRDIFPDQDREMSIYSLVVIFSEMRNLLRHSPYLEHWQDVEVQRYGPTSGRVPVPWWKLLCVCQGCEILQNSDSSMLLRGRCQSVHRRAFSLPMCSKQVLKGHHKLCKIDEIGKSTHSHFID